MATTETINVEVLLQSEEFRKGVKKVVSEMDDMEKKGRGVGKKSKSWLSEMKAGYLAIAAAIGTAVKALVDFGKKAVTAASEFEEANNKFNVVFKGVRSEANEMRKVLVNSYAMSSKEATVFLSAMQDMLVPMGLARDKASKMSFDIVKLSADLASFNKGIGATTESVMRDFQSALAGQIEPMRKYGVFLTQARIEQVAMNMGLWDGTGAITTQAKAMATLSIVTKDSKDAVGDLGRTYNSYANMIGRIKAVWNDILVIVGQEIIAKFKPALEGFLKLAGNAEDVRDVVYRVIAAFELLWSIATFGVEVFLRGMRLMIEPIVFMINLVGDLGAAWDALMNKEFRKASELAANAVKKNWKESIDNILDQGKALVKGFENDWENIKIVVNGKNKEMLTVAKDTAQEIADARKSGVQDAKDASAELTEFEKKQAEIKEMIGKKEWSTYVGLAKDAIKTISDFQKAQTEAEIDRIQMRLDAELEALEQQGLSEEEFEEQSLELQRQADHDIAVLKAAQFERERKAKIAETVMAGALAVVQAYAHLGPIAATIAAATIATLTGIKLATINAQEPPPIPAAAEGGIFGQHGPELIMVGERGPEMVLPAQQTAAMLGAGGGGNVMNVGPLNLTVNGSTPGAVERELYNGIRRLSRTFGVESIFKGRS